MPQDCVGAASILPRGFNGIGVTCHPDTLTIVTVIDHVQESLGPKLPFQMMDNATKKGVDYCPLRIAS